LVFADRDSPQSRRNGSPLFLVPAARIATPIESAWIARVKMC
jgi:hypothetical protein